jgi:phosphatidylserine/phosphatidylglycerophosphate/cardiolipin synthase-like enzyme
VGRRSLTVLPDDSAAPLLDAITGARKSLRIKMFIFSDAALRDAVIAAHHRGVKVSVILSTERRNGKHVNRRSHAALTKAGIRVSTGNPTFRLTHEKSMVIDDETAWIQSLNWATENLTATRDYAVTTTHPHEVGDVASCFEADWSRRAFTRTASHALIWCPVHGRDRIARFIDAARESLFVQNERYQDAIIIEHLVKARLRGVKVHVMARPAHTLRRDKLIEGVGGLRILDAVGVKIRRLKHLKLHGKILLADGIRAIIGSINLSAGSFDERRELGIELGDESVVARLREVVRHDWKHAEPLDLSDEGLLEDLEDRMDNVTERLALDVRGRKLKKEEPPED